MNIISIKPGHDGTLAYISDETLVYSFEGEKDSYFRYDPLKSADLVEGFSLCKTIPDVIAESGWMKGYTEWTWPVGAGYSGIGEKSVINQKTSIFGKEAHYFSSTHERSHLFCSYGLSPFPQGQAVYALIWEGQLGSFYEIDENLNIRKLGDVLEGPGDKYAYLFQLGDTEGTRIFSGAGKLMALAAYGEQGSSTKEEQEIIDFVLSKARNPISNKKDLAWSKYCNIGVQTQEFKNLARKFSDKIFNIFYDFAKVHCTKKLPLIIGGGCGLNCEWNTRWRESGLFEDVFIPPCTNDTGSAIGTAIDALREYTGKAKISWDVYSGREFTYDQTSKSDFVKYPVDYNLVAKLLKKGHIVPWVDGKAEIGPRALGHRSLLASPLQSSMIKSINKLKGREDYRPVAPICLEEDFNTWFSGADKSPYMLEFHQVQSSKIPAVRHVDGSARVQTINPKQDKNICLLLNAFKAQTGVSVLCNTSLNFPGRGFINSESDLIKFCTENNLDIFVMGSSMMIRSKEILKDAA